MMDTISGNELLELFASKGCTVVGENEFWDLLGCKQISEDLYRCC